METAFPGRKVKLGTGKTQPMPQATPEKLAALKKQNSVKDMQRMTQLESQLFEDLTQLIEGMIDLEERGNPTDDKSKRSTTNMLITNLRKEGTNGAFHNYLRGKGCSDETINRLLAIQGDAAEAREKGNETKAKGLEDIAATVLIEALI